ncbi:MULTISPECIES: inosamine-phosphate amidinotransferase 1 [Streptomyces]|uniref:inosamine-phosphate amidinotransferase 1 n=1 Tax=Streptomyces TaxID=1883 RepID=UPI00093EB446|nr:inosamine-phosphate amidinotransferase 1 [Streptomyces sp. CB02115]OKJ53255.1 inosamine-phosphate amidinotransferase 1 [Streptomyces sp. CB02115]WST89010.1 inosamine-phosphate amidinotransferase 1 [Streptomyces anulatus]WSU32597.1 inosamine-phosphate amidinotransferase 1 [Streptomyces anulatus]WSU88552.1 inosamine-phosphate amidinotransferase 1 [Streptomyces anulatus]
MIPVDVHNEWDPLEEVIVGTAVDALAPRADRSMMVIEFSDFDSPEDAPVGPYDQKILEETEEDLQKFADALSGLGVRVRRPTQRDHSIVAGTPDWETDSFCDYCPRDGFLAIGDTIIEAPMPLRSRFFEYLAYKDLFLEYFQGGARWIAAPKPRLSDAMYEPGAVAGKRLQNLEPCFDAANVIRLGSDLLYLVSDSGNELGARWLQSAVGSDYTVTPVRDVYAYTHIDTTFVPLRPGLVMVNSSRVTEQNMPEPLRGWDHIYAPEPIDTGYVGSRANGSIWVGMNMLSISPELVAVDQRQTGLIKELEKHRIDVLPVELRHSRALGGGFHCVTLDVRRRGTLESYR